MVSTVQTNRKECVEDKKKFQDSFFCVGKKITTFTGGQFRHYRMVLSLSFCPRIFISVFLLCRIVGLFLFLFFFAFPLAVVPYQLGLQIFHNWTTGPSPRCTNQVSGSAHLRGPWDWRQTIGSLMGRLPRELSPERHDPLGPRRYKAITGVGRRSEMTLFKQGAQRGKFQVRPDMGGPRRRRNEGYSLSTFFSLSAVWWIFDSLLLGQGPPDTKKNKNKKIKKQEIG